MRAACAITVLAFWPLAAEAQDITVPGAEPRVETGTGARLRGLDKVAGTTQDFRLSNGETAMIGHLELRLGECRYPAENPASEAYAWIDVTDTRTDARLFGGWMIATSPALNALDHARYDISVLSCITS